MSYTTINKSTEHFNTLTYTGDGSSSRNVTGVGFEPSLTWNKPRTTANDHQLVDAVRGGGKVISSNLTDAEYTAGNTILSFGSDGFTCGNGASVNANGVNYASWNWKAGTSFTNDASATGIGTIDSTGSVNTDAGFSIVNWTVGSAVNGLAVAHSLGVAPKIIIYKIKNGSSDWYVWLNKVIDSSQDYLVLNTNATKVDISSGQGIPSSTLISNFGFANAELSAYCFAEKQGYSKFGSYIGNGSTDGTFVYTGFKPAFVMIKSSSSAQSWSILDIKRDVNPNAKVLWPNDNYAEYDETQGVDFLSNGFKNNESGAGFNGSGATYIYMAFAEAPLVGTNGVTAKAR